MFGIQEEIEPPTDFFWKKARRSRGDLSFEILHCPGHCPGHGVVRATSVVFVGDVLFAAFNRTNGLRRRHRGVDAIDSRSCCHLARVRVLAGHGPTSIKSVERTVLAG
jgi:glyoxylase-like metal-dependent hydrolase (beta-lactamase superfamily II)